MFGLELEPLDFVLSTRGNSLIYQCRMLIYQAWPLVHNENESGVAV